MYRFLCLFLLGCLSLTTTKATHNRAGYISFEHISGFTYRIEVTTLTVPDSPADRPFLAVDFGDGNLDTVPRANGGGNGVIISPGVKENSYVTEHTYLSPGNYQVTMADPNRNGGILNIPNSVNVPFAIQSELIVSQSVTNSSPKPLSPITSQGQVGIPFTANLAFYDPDADFLTYELITPLGENGLPILDYTFSAGVTVNSVNGDFVWDSPSQQGEYNFAFKVKEYRNGVYLGSVIVDFQVTIYPSDFTGVFSETSNWPTNNSGDFAIAIEPNAPIELELMFDNGDVLESFGEPFLFGNTAGFDTMQVGVSSVSGTFNWTPSLQNLRCSPYTVCFRGTGDNDFTRDVSLLIYVHDQAIQDNPDCFVFLDVQSLESSRPMVYPNPSSDGIWIQLESDQGQDFSVRLHDATGRLMRQVNSEGKSELYLHRDNLKTGIYFYEILIETGGVKSGGVVFN